MITKPEFRVILDGSANIVIKNKLIITLTTMDSNNTISHVEFF